MKTDPAPKLYINQNFLICVYPNSTFFYHCLFSIFVSFLTAIHYWTAFFFFFSSWNGKKETSWRFSINISWIKAFYRTPASGSGSELKIWILIQKLSEYTDPDLEPSLKLSGRFLKANSKLLLYTCIRIAIQNSDLDTDPADPDPDPKVCLLGWCWIGPRCSSSPPPSAASGKCATHPSQSVLPILPIASAQLHNSIFVPKVPKHEIFNHDISFSPFEDMLLWGSTIIFIVFFVTPNTVL